MISDKPGNKFEIHVEERYALNAMPSGSGMVIYNGYAFIISDDAPWLFKIDLSSKEYSSIPLIDADITLSRIKKKHKPDYEALCMLPIGKKDHLLAFGSGSRSPTRDSLLIISLEDPTQQKKISLSGLYESLRSGNNKTINIEGAVTNAEDIFLMDREHNLIHQFSITDFLDFIEDNGTPSPTPRTHSLTFPGEAGARMSGGCLLDNKTMLFCASVENTADAINDGEIYGSFIGLMDIQEMQLRSIASLTNTKGNPLLDKIESLDIEGQYPNGDYKIWAIADNDDGTSVLFQLRIRFDWK